jgi:hypothetical protein
MAGGGGGKGDKTSSTIRLPKEIEALAKRNLAAAEQAGKIGYVPYQGPTVGALNEMQIGAMEQNEAAMRAFGMQPQSVRASIPTPNTYAGGIQGYDPMALYLQSLAKIDPAQRAAIESFTDPQGVAAANGRRDWSQPSGGNGTSFGMALSNTLGLNKKGGGEYKPRNYFEGLDRGLTPGGK